MLDKMIEDAMVSVPQRTEDRKKFYHYCFTTALEGGIGYWSVATEYSWSKAGGGAMVGMRTDIDDLDGFYAILESSEDDWGIERAYVAEQGATMDITETQALRVDINVIERGVNMLVDNVIAATKSENPRADFSRDYLKQFVVQWLTDMEDGDSDADVADLVVQLGLFNNVVYA